MQYGLHHTSSPLFAKVLVYNYLNFSRWYGTMLELVVPKHDFVVDRKDNAMKTLLIVLLSIATIGTYAQSAPTEQGYGQQIISLTYKISQEPNNADLYIKRAYQIYYLNAIYPYQTVSQFKLKDALVDINKAIKIDGQNPKLYSLRGMYKRNITSDLDGARADLTKAIELEPNNPLWYLERTNYSSLERACIDWKKCAELGNGTCEEIRNSVCSK